MVIVEDLALAKKGAVSLLQFRIVHGFPVHLPLRHTGFQKAKDHRTAQGELRPGDNSRNQEQINRNDGKVFHPLLLSLPSQRAQVNLSAAISEWGTSCSSERPLKSPRPSGAKE